MKKNARIASSLMAIALLSTAMISCGGESTDPGVNTDAAAPATETAAQTEPAFYDSVPELDFGGAALRVIQQEQPNYYIDEEEATGDVVE